MLEQLIRSLQLSQGLLKRQSSFIQINLLTMYMYYKLIMCLKYEGKTNNQFHFAGFSMSVRDVVFY